MSCVGVGGGGARPQREGTILGEPVLRGTGYQLIFPPMWRLALSGRSFSAKTPVLLVLWLFTAVVTGNTGAAELQYHPA